MSQIFVFLQDLQVLSKVEASLDVHQVRLRPEAKNFTQVATLSCRGDYYSEILLKDHVFFVCLMSR